MAAGRTGGFKVQRLSLFFYSGQFVRYAAHFLFETEGDVGDEQAAAVKGFPAVFACRRGAELDFEHA